MVPSDLSSVLSGLIFSPKESVQANTKKVLRLLKTDLAFRSAASADAWNLACKGKGWVQNLLQEAVPQRLVGSLERLGTLLLSPLTRDDQMFEPDIAIPGGTTSWAALTYLAVRHSQDCSHARWHHDFHSANRAWVALKDGLGEGAARKVCAMIAFQNTLRAMLRSPALGEVGISEPHSFVDGSDASQSKVKAVISAALHEEATERFRRSFAYAALALKGRHHGSLANHPIPDQPAGEMLEGEIDSDIAAIERFATLLNESEVTNGTLISFEYGSYVPEFSKTGGLRERILKMAQDEWKSNGTPDFCSISLGRHWRTSDFNNLSSGCKLNLPRDYPTTQWSAKDSSSDGCFFCHVNLEDFFRLWLDARFPGQPA